jgi:2-keto-4-pentenoate hydratase/2-oxohepta-3-ene-1,7-dioic acid hydratase in catechol pathway
VDMIFNVRQTISFLSRGTTLLPGDLIWTGTPPGVQLGHKPPHYLQNGEVVEVSIEGIGSCINEIQYLTREDNSFKAKF